MDEHIRSVLSLWTPADGLRHVVVLGETKERGDDRACRYESFFADVNAQATDAELKKAEARVMVNDIMNLQFTSGTTGRPKAACLTHRYILPT